MEDQLRVIVISAGSPNAMVFSWNAWGECERPLYICSERIVDTVLDHSIAIQYFRKFLQGDSIVFIDLLYFLADNRRTRTPVGMPAGPLGGHLGNVASKASTRFYILTCFRLLQTRLILVILHAGTGFMLYPHVPKYGAHILLLKEVGRATGSLAYRQQRHVLSTWLVCVAASSLELRQPRPAAPLHPQL